MNFQTYLIDRKILYYIIAILFSSCSTYIPTGYNSLAPNVPLMKSQFETQVRFSGGVPLVIRSGSTISTQEQIAFSPLKNIALIGNFYQKTSNEKSNTYETGMGYYKLLKDSFEIEIFGIYTNSINSAKVTDDISRDPIGGATEHDIIVHHNFKDKYQAVALQFDIGKHFKRMKLAFSFRYNLVRFNDFQHYTTSVDGYHNNYYPNTFRDTSYFMLPNKMHSFITFAPIFVLGMKRIKFCAELIFQIHPENYFGSTRQPPYYNQIELTNALTYLIDFKK